VLDAIQDNNAVRAVLASDERLAVVRPGESPDAFLAELRLLPGEALDAQRLNLVSAITDAIIDHPPHDLAWLRNLDARGIVDVRRFILDSSVDVEAVLPLGDFEKREHREMLLALRGLLALGLLEHCLVLRHRVDYGAAPELGRKRISLPFRASDMPSER
jgi:hypothetical protein